MPKPLSKSALPLTIAVLAAATSFAQAGPLQVELSAGIQCGGQYECVPDVRLTEAEAKTCLGYPRPSQQQGHLTLAAGGPDKAQFRESGGRR
jgi:hypothetical protein